VWNVAGKQTFLVLIALLTSCGGHLSSDSAPERTDSAPALCESGPCSAQPITDFGGNALLQDAFVTPTNPPLSCDDGSSVSLVLPCQLGQPYVHELECKLDEGSMWILDFFPERVTQGDPQLLEQPLDLTKFTSPPRPSASATLLRGTLQLREYHIQQRTFWGDLTDLTLSVKNLTNTPRTCRLPNGVLWAVAGNFF
jgi:hypothetical protein